MAFGPPPVKDANAGAPPIGIKLAPRQQLTDYQMPGQSYRRFVVELLGIHPGLLMAHLETTALPLPGDIKPRGGFGVKGPKPAGAKTKTPVQPAEDLTDEPPTDARDRKVIKAAENSAYLDPDNRTSLVCPHENLRSMFVDAGKCWPGSGLARACGSAVIIEPDFVPFLDPETDKPLKFGRNVRVVEHPVSSRKPAQADVLVLLYKAKSSTGKRIATARPYLPAWKLRFTVGLDMSLFTDDDAVDKFHLNVLAYSGAYVGLMAWRPGAPKGPGPFGRYQVTRFDKVK
jgi:hypothetical protein